MKKSILVVSVGAHTGLELRRELTEWFGQYADVDVAYCDQLPQKAQGYDIVLFSSESTAELCTFERGDSTQFLSARRVIDHGLVDELVKLPPGTKVLLVNDCVETALEAIDQLIEIGFGYLDYSPYYPECSVPYKGIAVAVTPGEAHYVPAHVSRVIDIGVRRLDIGTLYEVMMALGAGTSRSSSLVTGYIRDIVEISKRIEHARIESERTSQLLQVIFHSVDAGIAFVDENGVIAQANAVFASLFDRELPVIIAQPFDDLLPGISLPCETREDAVDIGDKNLLIDIKAVRYGGRTGSLVTVRSADEIVRMDHRMRSQRDRALQRELYTFDDYRTWDEGARRTIRLAKRFAATDATILIEGESGTGKEILAQSIHMASSRRHGAFVPFNVNALPSTLVESELFGYEEGSFTGAKKGGKAGLFELAHNGTLFIDEIGDASADFQIKLLRVLEQRRIRKVGGGEEVPVDVRIIAATNRNIADLIRQGRFREDLFFRLNVLPIRTIPLRRRPADILGLFRFFSQRQFGISRADTRLADEVARFLEQYSWTGNVRELMNVVEYIWLTADAERVGMDNLPGYVFDKSAAADKVHLGDNEWLVLSAIRESGSGGIGRSRLCRVMAETNADIGEGRMRSTIAALEAKGLVERRRTGNVITAKGLAAWQRQLG